MICKYCSSECILIKTDDQFYFYQCTNKKCGVTFKEFICTFGTGKTEKSEKKEQ